VHQKKSIQITRKEVKMALKFKCDNCGKEVIVKYLRRGETAKCRFCGVETVVPDDAVETGEEPMIVRHLREAREEPIPAGKEEGNPFPLVPFASGHSRARMLMYVLVVAILLAVVSVGSTYFQIGLAQRMLDGSEVAFEEREASFNRQVAILVLKFGVLIAIFAFLLIWVHRAYRNLPALGVRGLKFSPGEAVRSWFRKIASLYQPHQVIKEIWKGSDPNVDLTNGSSWKDASSWSVITWWWFLWMVIVPVNLLVFGFSLEAERWEELAGFSWAVLVSEVLFIVTCNLLILVVRATDVRQEEKNRRIRQLGISPVAHS
jgi:predicted RNA-binding Zn-ribbon protein involved in translation (DUF1610 family)